MSDVVIRVENLSKEYRLGTISHGTLYRDLQSGWAKLRGTVDPNARIGAINRVQLNNTNDRFSALKDVTFDVRQGEIVGIIGRNGAGKSTLLKIISRVTAPTSGTIKIKGRVASLLEVGTGFHPELTGRENIFLNGAILGMHKGEIEQKFDEIVKFAEIDQFIDTPVKRYSSGMYVRLAFAVAAHLEPEILVVDEVLAVGDAGFQKKCLGKMGDISKEGRTVLFVSHNMGAISSLCSRGILIENGIITSDGNVDLVVNKYIQDLSIDGYSALNIDVQKYPASIVAIGLKSSNGINTSAFLMTEPIIVECNLKIIKISHLTLSVQIKETNMEPIFHFPNGDSSFKLPTSPGDYLVSVKILPLNLYPRSYIMRVALTNVITNHQEAIDGIRFDINQDYNICTRPLTRQAGLIFGLPEWSCSKLDNK